MDSLIGSFAGLSVGSRRRHNDGGSYRYPSTTSYHYGASYRRPGVASPRGHYRSGLSYELPTLASIVDLYSSLTYDKSQDAPPTFPDVFDSKAHYVNTIKQSINAEYAASVGNAYKFLNGKSKDEDEDSWTPFSADKKGLYLSRRKKGDSETWSQHLVQIEGESELQFVVYAKDDHVVLKSSGGAACLTSGRVRSVAYIGSFKLQYSCAEGLEASSSTDEILRLILNPADQTVSESTLRRMSIEGVNRRDLSLKINLSQAQAVVKLRPGLDVIQGPPGTGKSTTIWHIIRSRLQPNAQCLVTCTRNQAVDAIVEKIASFGVLVFGSEDRLGHSARLYTLAGRLESDPEVVFWNKVSNRINAYKRAIQDLKKAATAVCVKRYPGALKNKWTETILRVMAQRFVLRKCGRAAWNKIQRWRSFLATASSKVSGMIIVVRERRQRWILAHTRVYLCTIDSTARMAFTLQEKAVTLALDTCIVDEAGCVLESAIPVLLSYKPNNIFLIGDHHQLPPFSDVYTRPGSNATKHDRSLLERSVAAGLKPHFLETQYRMHPKICELVSDLFYDRKLLTGPLVRNATVPCAWIDVKSKEEAIPKRGYTNRREAKAVCALAEWLLETIDAKKTIYIVTFYNKQRNMISDMIKMDPFFEREGAGRILTLSIDACQGSECDYMIFSTVRTNDVGPFMEDKRRLCVALSRAKEQCFIVGDRDNMSSGSTIWRKIARHYPPASVGLLL